MHRTFFLTVRDGVATVAQVVADEFLAECRHEDPEKAAVEALNAAGLHSTLEGAPFTGIDLRQKSMDAFVSSPTLHERVSVEIDTSGEDPATIFAICMGFQGDEIQVYQSPLLHERRLLGIFRTWSGERSPPGIRTTAQRGSDAQRGLISSVSSTSRDPSSPSHPQLHRSLIPTTTSFSR